MFFLNIMHEDQPIGNCRPCDFIEHRLASTLAHVNSTNDGAKHKQSAKQ